MADKSGYIGRNPGDSSVTVARQTFEPSGVQTNFTFASGYDPGYIDAYLNGARLVRSSDYSASNGSTVGLTSAAQNGDILELVAYKAFNLAAVTDATGNFTVGSDISVGGDASVGGELSVTGVSTFIGDLYVGGDLYVADDVVYDEVVGRNINISGIGTIVTLNSTNLTVSGITTSASTIVGSAVTISATGVNVAGIVTAESSYVGSAVTTDSQGVRVAGIVTASSFVGDGANLTGVISGIEVQEEGSQVGTSITMVNFVGSDITATAAGSASTITVSVTVPAGWNELDAALFN